MSETAGDHRRATAERNVEAILAAAEALLGRGEVASTSAVAREAGVSRVTVYAHFPTREALLEAVAERSVRGFTAALDDADLQDGPPVEVLERLIARSWSQLDRHGAIAEAATEHLSSAALVRAHEALRGPIAALIERGRAEGVFRADLPTEWLVSSYFALMHACGDDVLAGRIDASDAAPILQATIRDVFAGSAG